MKDATCLLYITWDTDKLLHESSKNIQWKNVSEIIAAELIVCVDLESQLYP